MYNELAYYYDKLGFDEYSYDAIEIINNILFKNNIIPESICDLCCGTGSLIKLMEQYYCAFNIYGVDLSSDMIKVAAEKLAGTTLSGASIKLMNADMCKFKLETKVKLITCMFDSINHLNDKGEVRDSFGEVFNNLEDDGIFIFDFIPEGGINKYDDQIIKDSKNITTIKDMSADKKSKTIEIRMKSYISNEEKNEVIKIEESHIEKAFKISDIIKALKGEGFKHICLYNLDGKKIPLVGMAILERSSRVYISARK